MLRRLPSSFNEDDILDSEIDEVLDTGIEVALEPRDHGERVMIVGFSSTRTPLIEIGIEDQNDELVVFHAREATPAFKKEFEGNTHGRL